MTEDTFLQIVGIVGIVAGCAGLLVSLVRRARGRISGENMLTDGAFAGSTIAIGLYLVLGWGLLTLMAVALMFAGWLAQRRLKRAEGPHGA